MKTTTKSKLDDAIKNAESYIEQMKLMDDKKLSKHIDLLQQQIDIARKKGNETAVQLLQEYEWQTIIARVEK